MQKNSEFRLICSFEQSAKTNMAIDKALATLFRKDDMPILRLYTWEDSFTVGVVQKTEDYINVYSEYDGNCAKRITGGGVLFHGHDLSYSLVLPSSFSKDLSVKETYEKICSFLIRFYRNLGLEADYAKDIPSINLSKSNFCQVGFEAYDIIVNGLKIGGNAQKWSKHMIFQHGSIPIEAVESKEELGNSLVEVGVTLTYAEAIDKLMDAFEQTFEVKLTPSALSDKEKEKVEEILK